MKKIISGLLILSMMISSFNVFVSAKYTEEQTKTYQFSDNSTVDNTFWGIAAGSAAWNDEDNSLGDYLTFSQTKNLTVTSEGSSVFASLDKNMTSSDFEISTNMSISTSSTSNFKYAGIAFGANDGSYYQILFSAAKKARFSKTNALVYAGTGSNIIDPINISENLYSQNGEQVKIKAKQGSFELYIGTGSTPVISYSDSGFSPSGFFGFVSSNNISATYSNFKIDMKTTVTVYEESDYQISDVNVAAEEQNVILTWKNPDVPDISEIIISDRNGDTVTGYKGTITKAQAAENRITISGEERNTELYYKVTVKFSEHADVYKDSDKLTLPFLESDYNVEDFDIAVQQKGAKITWKNPVAGEITSIEIKDSDEKVYTHSASLESGKANEVVVDNLVRGKSYTFTLTVNIFGRDPQVKTKTITVPEANEGKYYPKNVHVHVKNEKLGISWVNPERESLSAIKILNHDTGMPCEVEIFTGEELSVSPSVSNRILVSGLSSTEPSKIRLVFEFSDGHKDVEYVCEETASRTVSDYEQQNGSSYPDYTKLDNWQAFYNVQVAKFPQMAARMYIDREEKISGTSSMKIISNLKTNYGNVYYRIRQTINNYNPEQTYLVSMWVKYKNAKDSILICYDDLAMNSYIDGTDTSRNGITATRVTTKQSTDGWEKIEYLMKPEFEGEKRENGKEIRIQFSSFVEEFRIDDLQMVPVDSENNIIGENIILNGEFDVADNEACSRVGANTEESRVKDGTAQLKWKNPDDTSFAGVMVYEEIEGELFEIARLKSADGVVFTNAEGENAIKYVVKTLDTSDNLSNATEFVLTPSFSDCIISDISFEYNGEIVSQLPDNADGVVTAGVSVKNNLPDAFKGSLWIAVYEDGVLKAVVQSTEGIFEKGKEAVILKASFDAEKKDGYYAEAFLLDNITNMKLLTDAAIIR